MSTSPATNRPALSGNLANKSAAELLATPVQFLKGVGPDRAKLMERLGLRTAADVLFNFPRDYQDLTRPASDRAVGGRQAAKRARQRGRKSSCATPAWGVRCWECWCSAGRCSCGRCGSTCRSWRRSFAKGRKCCSRASRGGRGSAGRWPIRACSGSMRRKAMRRRGNCCRCTR